MTDELPEKLDLASMDIAEEKRKELLLLFPEIRTEDGKIDFEQLKIALGEVVDVGKERYGMNWPGKAECFKTIQTPSVGTLRPCREESVNFDSTENLIIEGDSLEVLKLLQKSYLGKIKVIYIDPPYNTGNDFIYPDNYTESLQTYLEYTGQVDSQGKKFSTNTEADGRFHSKWLNMMHTRLYLARNLLRDDALVFISIDDTEVDNLKKLANDIFGEENFVEQIVWKNKYNSGAMTRGFSNVHEYILCYTKKSSQNIFVPLSEDAIAEYKNRDAKFPTRGGYVTQPLATGSKDLRPNLRFPIRWKGKEIWPEKQWLWSKERVEAALANDEIVVNETDGKLNVRVKQYLKDEHGNVRKTKPLSIMVGPYNQEGSKEVDDLLGKDVFEFPKPSALIKYLLSISTEELNTSDYLIMDFTAGSGTTAQAVLELNRENSSSLKYILIQLPEVCDPESAAARAGYKTIADICKERIRRVIGKLNKQTNKQLPMTHRRNKDEGFRVFKLAESNIKSWEPGVEHDAVLLGKQLDMHVDHIRQGRSSLDLLYEILLKTGYMLTTPVQELTLERKTVYSIADGALIVCLEQQLTLELIRAIAEKKPERVVFLDEGFAGNDQLKVNAVQIFKTKGTTSFKTV